MAWIPLVDGTIYWDSDYHQAIAAGEHLPAPQSPAMTAARRDVEDTRQWLSEPDRQRVDIYAHQREADRIQATTERIEYEFAKADERIREQALRPGLQRPRRRIS